MRLNELVDVGTFITKSWIKLLVQVAFVSALCLGVYNMCLLDLTGFPLSYRAMYGIVFISGFLLSK